MARFNLHSLPGFLRSVPPATIGIILLLLAINALAWIVAGIVLHFHPALIAPAALSYALGLRHALDADHISAIDLMTRRLIASGQRPVTVGTFFSLGHSTIVVVTCVVVAATSGALRDRFDDFTRVGNIVGTSVSAVFLLVLSAGNGWVLYRLICRLREVLAEPGRPRVRAAALGQHDDADVDAGAAAAGLGLDGPGLLSRVFRRLFDVIDRPWKMFPLGVMFGLGFDTSSEIAILGITSLQGAAGTSLWLILIFPMLFTAGMCLVDTSDGALMMGLYSSKAFARDQVAILYYSIVLTGITVFISAFIGIIQVFSLIRNVADPQGGFWDGVEAISDSFDIIGASICGLFLVIGIGSVVAYRPWRRRMERKIQAALVADADSEGGLASPLHSDADGEPGYASAVRPGARESV